MAFGSEVLRSEWLRDDSPRPGDVVILSGPVGDHGISLLSFREGYGFETEVTSDIAPLNGLMAGALKAGGVVSAKDLTRGGLANASRQPTARLPPSPPLVPTSRERKLIYRRLLCRRQSCRLPTGPPSSQPATFSRAGRPRGGHPDGLCA